MAFIEKMSWMTGVMVDDDAVRRVAYENVEDAQKEGLDYVELRFSPWFMCEAHRLELAGVVAAVVDGVQAAARDTGMRVKLIGILSRSYGPEIAWKELEALLSQHDHLTLTWRVMGQFPGECSPGIYSAVAMLAGRLPSTRGRRWAHTVFGRLCASWGPGVLGTPCMPLKILLCWSIWLNTELALNLISQVMYRPRPCLITPTTPCAVFWSTASWLPLIPTTLASATLPWHMNMVSLRQRRLTQSQIRQAQRNAWKWRF
jgi:hypothetical protein